MTQPSRQTIDSAVTIEQKRAQAMRLRNAYLEVLRAFEDMHDLPRSVPSKVERGEAPPKVEHHNR